MAATVRQGDASGRGAVEGFKVSCPARLHPYSEESVQAVVDVMRNVECQTQGEYLGRFEADFKAYTGVNHAFGVNSATSSLRLASILCRLKPGDEVIISAYTFCATAIPFAKTGAKIVWADIDPDTWVADPADIERKITEKTKAVVAVHLLGMPVNMPAVLKLARKHNLKVVEDCAQAPGASIDGQKTGTFGDFGCFSMHGAKNITTLGEGGVLTVQSDEDAALVPGLRHNGCRPYTGPRERYWLPAMSDVDLDIEGVLPEKFCIGEAQCALASSELKRLDQINAGLIDQAEKIKAKLADTPEIEFAKIPEGYKHIFHQYIMHYNGAESGTCRNDLLDLLTGKYKIRCSVQYHPLYRYPLFQKMGFGDQDCPVLEKWWDDSFSFPWWCDMPDETIDYLVESAAAVVQELKEQSSK